MRQSGLVAARSEGDGEGSDAEPRRFAMTVSEAASALPEAVSALPELLWVARVAGVSTGLVS